jgi:putative ABC transport system permease protein
MPPSLSLTYQTNARISDMQDLKFAVRQFRKNPGFTLFAVLTLGVGIGANTALFSVIYGALLRPLPFAQQGRLVTLWESNPRQGVDQERVSPPTYSDWQEHSTTLEALAFWTGPTDLNVLNQSGSEKVRASYPSSELFRVLQVEPEQGRGFVFEEDRPEGPQTAVISQRLWQQRFGGDPDVLGRSITVDTYGRRTYTIIGVMPQGFNFPEDTDLWLAAGWNGLPRDHRSGHWLNTLARLKPGVTLAQARAEANVVQAGIAREHPGERVGSEVSVVPLLRQTVGAGMRTALFVLWGAVAGVLLLACVNVANLMLARAVNRQREIAVRLALGAAPWRILRQLLLESLLLALLAGAAGTLLAVWGVKLLVMLSPANIPRLADVSVDRVALCFTLGAAAITGLVFGLAPAWQCARTNLQEAFAESSRATSGGMASERARSFLVIVEVALATVLLVGAGLMLQSFGNLLTTDRGFRADHVLTADLDFSVSGFTTWVRATDTRPQVRLKELLDRLRQSPGVDSAGVAYQFLRQDNAPPVNWPFTVFGKPTPSDAERPTAEHNAISPGYLRALGIHLVRGRDFTEADTLDAPGVALVNESFVRRYFPNQNPLGQHVSGVTNPGPLGSKDRWGVAVWCEIVGVVGDVKSLTPQPEAVPEIYRSYWQWPMQSPKLFMRASGAAGTLAAVIRRETRAVIPSLPVPPIRLLTEHVGDSLTQPRFQTGLLTLFAAVALLLASCGIYAVLAYAVTQRQREIGVRMALGAQRQNVLFLILSRGLKWVVLGLLIGILSALAFTRVIGTLLYGVTPTDPITFAAVVGTLLLAGCLAGWLPARRATRVEPMEALRHE